jgi:hypothetical protein
VRGGGVPRRLTNRIFAGHEIRYCEGLYKDDSLFWRTKSEFPRIFVLRCTHFHANPHAGEA